MSCEYCRKFCERERIGDPSRYLEVIRQLSELVNRGELAVVSGTCSLESIADTAGPWPDDLITHVLRCTHCDQQFTISIDAYHGGGAWGPTVASDNTIQGKRPPDSPPSHRAVICERLRHASANGVESRCMVGLHGRSFRDYYRFSSPASRPATAQYIRRYYDSLGYAMVSNSRLEFKQAAKRMAWLIGTSELRYERTIRAVVGGDEAGTSTVKLIYRIRCPIGIRIINDRCPNRIEQEVHALADFCQECYEAGA